MASAQVRHYANHDMRSHDNKSNIYTPLTIKFRDEAFFLRLLLPE